MTSSLIALLVLCALMILLKNGDILIIDIQLSANCMDYIYGKQNSQTMHLATPAMIIHDSSTPITTITT